MWKLLFILLLEIICSIQSFSQIKDEFDNLTFYIPQGLTAIKTDHNISFTDPTISNEQFTITLNKSTFSLKKIEKSFPVFWREALLTEGIDNPGEAPSFVKAKTNAGWSSFRGGKLVQQNDQAPAIYYHMTVLKYAGITNIVVTRSTTEELFNQKYPLLIQLVSSVNLKTQPVPQTTPPAQSGTVSQ